jgi:hypothetical protein
MSVDSTASRAALDALAARLEGRLVRSDDATTTPSALSSTG